MRTIDRVGRCKPRPLLRAALEAFIRRWFFHDDGSFNAAFHTFKTPDQFEQPLEKHLRKLIRAYGVRRTRADWIRPSKNLLCGYPAGRPARPLCRLCGKCAGPRASFDRPLILLNAPSV